MSSSTKSVYQVAGMTCGHCRSSVLEEVGDINEVSSVEVDLDSGRLEVEGVEVTADQVRTAVELAGYKLKEVD